MIKAKARSAFSKKKKNESSLSLFLKRRKESEGLALIHCTGKKELGTEGAKICSGPLDDQNKSAKRGCEAYEKGKLAFNFSKAKLPVAE